MHAELPRRSGGERDVPPGPRLHDARHRPAGLERRRAAGLEHHDGVGAGYVPAEEVVERAGLPRHVIVTLVVPIHCPDTQS